MAFSRDDLAAYEQQDQTIVPDPVIAKAPAATEPEPSQAEPATEAESSTADVSDQTESGDVTSDEEADTSTANATDDGETEEGETEGEEPAEGETSAEGEESTDPQPKTQSRASKRIRELNSKMLEASDLAEGYKKFGELAQEQLKKTQAELELLKAGGAKPAATTPAAEPPKTAAPKLGPMPKLTDPDINFDPDILAEKTAEWTQKAIQAGVQEALGAQQQRTQEEVGKAQARKALETFETRITEFKKLHTDWDTKVKNPELPHLHPAAQTVLVKTELGPQILYYLADNVSEAKRITALPPEDQAMEMGVIKARLELEAKTANGASKSGAATVTGTKPVAKKSVSQAPPPPTPVPAGRRAQSRDITDPGMGIEEFARRHREEKNNARLASRKMRGLK